MLDTFTLVVCTTLINAMMVVTLIALYRTSPSEKSILDWLAGISCFFVSNIFGLTLSAQLYNHWLAPAVANTLFVAGNGLILSGICRYLHGKHKWPVVLFAATFTFLVHLLPFMQESTQSRMLVTYPLIIAICFSAVVVLCRRQLQTRLFGLLPLTVVIGAFTAQLTLRFIALTLDSMGINIFSHNLIINSGTLGVMLYVMALAMSVAYLVNWVREQSLKKMSHTDTLTGWLNRRAFTQRMPQLFAATRHHRQPFACIVMDIDMFKQVNDTYGHTVGDEVLIHVSHQMRRVTRDCEYYYRLGGEEFVLLLPGCDEKQAMLVAERVRKAVEASPYLHEDNALNCSVSLGVAVITANGEGEWESLLKAADNAMYKAKASGRNTTKLNVLSHPQQHAANGSSYQASKNLSA